MQCDVDELGRPVKTDSVTTIGAPSQLLSQEGKIKLCCRELWTFAGTTTRAYFLSLQISNLRCCYGCIRYLARCLLANRTMLKQTLVSLFD